MQRVLIDSGPPAEREHVYEAITIDERNFALYRLRNGRRLVNLLTQTQQS